MRSEARVYAYAACVPASALKAYEYKTAANTSSNRAVAHTPECPQGTYLLSGGAGVPDSAAKPLWSNTSPPNVGENRWKASAVNSGSLFTKLTVHAFAVCGAFAGQ